MLRLRVKTRDGKQYPLTECLCGDSTLKDLLLAVQVITLILPVRQKILTGYPPKVIRGSPESTLSSLGIQGGELLIVEEADPSTNVTCMVQESLPPSSHMKNANISNLNVNRDAALPLKAKPENANADAGLPFKCPTGMLLKKVVPSDNSCLFARVYYLINGGESIDSNRLQEMRELVANVIRSKPDLYNEAVLERSNSNYCEWILKDTSWGGAIELSIFSQYYEIEIVALDLKTGILNRFGEDKKYDHRMIVLYDGVHYDPVYMETFEGNNIYIFPTTDDSVLHQAKEVAMEAKHSGQYTDTNTFRLECKECGITITGEDEALAHAKKTGHSKFEEIHRN
uniref:Ubiquitin thioesterase OTU n=1 Tax=Scylla olivacea TaxID=85551 RepID=A0A0P4VND1_SCYOL